MDPDASPVKTRRRYDSTGGATAPDRTQAHVLDGGRASFLARRLCIHHRRRESPRRRACPSRRSTRLFGGKPGLIRAIQQVRACRHRAGPAPDRSDEMSAQGPPPRAILRHWATLTTEVMPRVAPIILLVRAAAATDPDMAGCSTEINDQRLTRMHHNASRLANHGPLRNE